MILLYLVFQGFVGQEPTLFDDSIGNNIIYGVRNVSQEKIETAAIQANAHDFITSMEEQYNTQIGENTQLSGGQTCCCVLLFIFS